MKDHPKNPESSDSDGAEGSAIQPPGFLASITQGPRIAAMTILAVVFLFGAAERASMSLEPSLELHGGGLVVTQWSETGFQLGCWVLWTIRFLASFFGVLALASAIRTSLPVILTVGILAYYLSAEKLVLIGADRLARAPEGFRSWSGSRLETNQGTFRIWRVWGVTAAHLVLTQDVPETSWMTRFPVVSRRAFDSYSSEFPPLVAHEAELPDDLLSLGGHLAALCLPDGRLIVDLGHRSGDVAAKTWPASETCAEDRLPPCEPCLRATRARQGLPTP